MWLTNLATINVEWVTKINLAQLYKLKNYV
jgi:hypothetical protein